MRSVWAIADSVVSPLGVTSEENYQHVKRGISGITEVHNQAWSDQKLFVGKCIIPHHDQSITRFEFLCTLALQEVLKQISLPAARTLFILSTTKGNVDELQHPAHQQIRPALHSTANFLQQQFGFKHGLVVSNACISGVLALIAAKRWIESNHYDHAVVVGADVLSHFVISGFQSLQALSDEPCRPFDAHRKGINLGEAAAAMVVSAKPEVLGFSPRIRLTGAGLSNDANHISGPSRTGHELSAAIGHALQAARLQPENIDFISAHGTATLYNDEMESKAFTHARLANIPTHSLKGHFGHTLGAAGLVEVVMGIKSMEHAETLPTCGYETHGVSEEINICRKVEPRTIHQFLKTASGFGGCNAALVVERVK